MIKCDKLLVMDIKLRNSIMKVCLFKRAGLWHVESENPEIENKSYPDSIDAFSISAAIQENHPEQNVYIKEIVHYVTDAGGTIEILNPINPPFPTEYCKLITDNKESVFPDYDNAYSAAVFALLPSRVGNSSFARIETSSPEQPTHRSFIDWIIQAG